LDSLVLPLAYGQKIRKEAAYQPFLGPTKPVLRFKMKGLPPSMASRELLLRFFDSLRRLISAAFYCGAAFRNC